MGLTLLQSSYGETMSEAFENFDCYGINLFEEDIDNVIFRTNDFLTNSTFIGSNGPFWYILQICMCLGALFGIIMAAGMAYKMMVKGEPFDVLKIMKALGIALVMCWWYPPSYSHVNGFSGSWCILDGLAYIPNCIGSWTHDLYEAEATVVQAQFDQLTPLYHLRDEFVDSAAIATNIAAEGEAQAIQSGAATDVASSKNIIEGQMETGKVEKHTAFAGLIVMADKFMMLLSILLYKIGFWGTIYCQQILLGMLTIFGPIQWAFSLLPKWEGAWAKWIIRYLTVHFYGAMLYFVGFYVLLLFDIAISIQIADLEVITANPENMMGYVNSAFMTAGYLLVSSVVAMKCLDLVPDLAAWMIPEGETAFSTRSFGSGIAGEARQGASRAMNSVGR